MAPTIYNPTTTSGLAPLKTPTRRKGHRYDAFSIHGVNRDGRPTRARRPSRCPRKAHKRALRLARKTGSEVEVWGWKAGEPSLLGAVSPCSTKAP